MNHPIGANTWIWTSPLTDERVAELAPRLRAWGFSIVELPIENLGDWDPARTRDLLQTLGLGATTCLVMPPGRDLVGDDRQQTRDTQDYLKACIDVAAAIGARVVAGPAYAPVGKTWLMSSDERRTTITRLVESLRPIVAHAEKKGLAIGIEPLNRYETSLINTALDALDAADYRGPLCIESFSAGNMSLARAASIWRPLERSQDAIATDGLAFLTGLLARRASQRSAPP